MRAFAGLPLPPELSHVIWEWIRRWSAGFSGLKLVEEENLHITLFFFGEIDAGQAEKLAGCIGSLEGKRIKASLGEPGCFPPKGAPRVYYIGLDRGREGVCALYRDFIRAIARLGYRAEKQEFIPHITCARTRRSHSRLPLPPLEKLAGGAPRGLEFVVDRLILFESRLSPTGPIYSPIKTIMLSPGNAS